MELKTQLTRRQLVGTGAGLAGAGLAFGMAHSPTRALASACATLTPTKEVGPYFVEESLNRSDITTDPSTGVAVVGVPLALNFTLLDDDNGCLPLEGAQIDLWHAAPSGLYSDEAVEGTSGKKYLRGYQISDANGLASFKTIYPGWYSGRAVHIHARIRIFSGTTATYDFLTQLFFDDTLTDAVYTQAPYSSRPSRDTLDAADRVYGTDGAEIQLAPTADGSGGYVAAFTFSLSSANQGDSDGTTTTGSGAATTPATTTGTTTTTTATATTTSVLASLKAVRFSRTVLGSRVMHVALKTGETVGVDVRLLRGTKTLLRTRRSALFSGTHTLKITIPHTVTAGRATLEVIATDAGKNRKPLQKIVQIPTRAESMPADLARPARPRRRPDRWPRSLCRASAAVLVTPIRNAAGCWPPLRTTTCHGPPTGRSPGSQAGCDRAPPTEPDSHRGRRRKVVATGRVGLVRRD
jgi:protocatechuate 3,4-dioxygenase beta subunit